MRKRVVESSRYVAFKIFFTQDALRVPITSFYVVHINTRTLTSGVRFSCLRSDSIGNDASRYFSIEVSRVKPVCIKETKM